MDPFSHDRATRAVTASRRARPCPQCGGTDRFYLIASPRSGGGPFWLCNLCRYTEGATDDRATDPARVLTEGELAQARHGMAAVADWCATLLWTPAGADALAYLRGRGLSDATIARWGLGWHPDDPVGGVGPVLWARDKDAYAGAQLAGLIGPQGRAKSVLRGCITLPYRDAAGVVALIRGRCLRAHTPAKYLSPAGVALYGGAPPLLYMAPLLAETRPETPLLLAEGEFKALAAWQAGVAAVAQPGVAYLPDAFVGALAHRTVIVCYDREARKDPFTPSPGETYTLRAVARLTGIDVSQRLAQLLELAGEIKGQAKTASPMEVDKIIRQLEAIEGQIETLKAAQQLIRSLGLVVKVLRLPRAADQAKVDIDSYILAHGADAFRTLVDHAEDAERWHAAHDGGGYRFQYGGIWNGVQITNYQAIITETVYQSDGAGLNALHRLALRAPSGARRAIEVPDADWADDRAARTALRVGLREGTFDDDPREVLRAIRRLSNQGDPPIERTVFTATGWERIEGKWHYLVSDGAITATGPTSAVKAELDAEAVGNHYAICGPGDPAQGAAAWLAFLRGAVCPQPLALILAAQACLPLIHRFAGTTDRTMAWLYHQSGALKTSLVRASVLALYGPTFTAERAGGAAVPKWDATSVGLGLLAFIYRDLPVLVDDYKQGVIHPEAFKRFLHNYSESTGRTRGTKTQTVDRMRQARCIVFSTAEDLPTAGGDYGMEARLLAMQLHPTAVNADALAELQRAGAAGHLAAFWRGLIQALAGELDAHGEPFVRARIQDLIRIDDAALPGHRRAAGALRQNRMAWLLLSHWLHKAGHLTPDEATALNAAHLDARSLLADVLLARQQDSRPSVIFLGVLRELLESGELLLERQGMACARCGADLQFTDQAWYCTGTVGEAKIPCSYQISADRVIGFDAGDGSVGLFADRAFRAVSRVRNDQRQPFTFSSTAIWQQLDADGVLVAKGRDGRFTIQKRNPARLGEDGYGRPSKVLLLKGSAIRGDEPDPESSDSPEFGNAHKTMGSMGSMGSNGHAPQQDAESAEAANGIEWDQNRGGVGSGAVGEDGLIPIDPIRSHAWDQKNSASGPGEPGLDPIDPMKSPTQPKNFSAPAGMTNESFAQAVAAWQADNTFAVGRLAREARMDYATLVAAIKRVTGEEPSDE